MHVLHRCDKPHCINPEHLFLGTPADNSDDKVAKGRQAKGETQGQAKLTRAQVAEIRASDESGATLGERYGVSRSNINHIRRNERWVD